jgi:tetratricopeptide (TPR) repeat protein
MVLINELPLEDRTDPRIQHLHAKFFLTRGIVRERIDQSGALDDFERAEQLLRMLVDRDPMNRQFGLSLVITLIYKEGFLRNVNDLGLGRILWEEIRQRTESLYNLEPNWVRLRNFLIWSDVYRSRYMMHSVQTARYSDLSEEGALDVLNRSIEMHGELAEEVPLISASISALNYERGRVLASLGREEASIDAYGQSRRNFSETVESDMGARNARLYLWSLLGEGRAFRSAEQDEEGIERFLTGRRIAELAIQRAEAEGGADDYARATAINWRGDFNYQLSISYRLTGDAIAARSHILHAIDDYRLAMDLSPGTRLFHQNLAVSFYELGWVEHKAEDWSQAIEAFGESIRHLAMLVEQDFSDEWARGMLGDTVPSALESLESAMADDPETSERLFDAFDGLERQAELSLNISLRHEREETPFGDQTGWPMQPVIPGGWALHTLDMSNSLTQRIFRALEDVVDEAYEIVKIRSREIDFYPESRLIEVEVREDDLRGVVVFVEHDEELTHITGISTVIHRLNHLAPLVIDTPLKAMNYLRFFTTCIQGEHGAFTIVDHSGDLLWNDDRTLEDWVRAEEALRAFEISRGSDGAWRMYGTVVYSNAIFDAAFTVNRTGNVDMVNDSPTHAELPISVTRFVDGIRMIDHIEPVSED